MKRIGILSGLALAALALTNCSTKEIEVPAEVAAGKEGVPFEIIALAGDETRTTVDGMNTTWESTDEINLFHAVAGETTYINDGVFTIADTETGQFTGQFTGTSTPIQNTAYDWYVLYPYDANLTTIAGENGTNRWYTLGSVLNGTQTQASVGSTAHLGGQPLYGIKKNAVYNGSAPIIQMNQFASVAAVTITNKTSADINVSNIEFTAPEYVVGTFYLDILGETVNFTPSTNSAGTTIYASETAKLTVTDGTLAKDDVGVFYIAIKPFTAHSGDVISLKVTTDAGDSQTKEFNLDRDYTFAAGKMKTVKMNFTKEHQDLSGTYYQITSVDDITADGYYMIVMPDYSDTPYLYYALKSGEGQTGNLQYFNSGFTLDDDGLLSYTDPSDRLVWGVQSISADGGVNFRQEAGASYYSISSSGTDVKTNGQGNGYWVPSLLSSQCFQLTAKVVESGTTKYRYLSFYNGNAKAYETSAVRKYDQVETHTAPGQYACAWAILKLGAAPTTTPKIMDAVASDLSPRGSAANTVNVTKKNTESAIKILSYDGTVVTAASISGNTVTFTTANNYTSSARTGTITVALDDDETVTGTITVNQLASEFHLPNDATEATKQVNAAANSQTTINVTSDFDWTIDATNLVDATATPASFTYPASGSNPKTQTVTIKATAANASADEKALGSFKIVRTADNAELTVTVTQKSAKLSAPTGLAVEWSNKANLTAGASWNAVTNASSYAYKVEYDNGTSFIAETPAASNSATFTIAAGTLYKIYVKAVGDNNNWFDSDWSDPVSFNLTADTEYSFTWDLTKAEYYSKTDDLVTWTNSNATMTWAKNGGTKVTNYLGDGSNSHSRIYKNNIWTITPASGVSITKVEITTTGTSHADNLAGYTWTNASTSKSGSIVTLTPSNGSSAMSATMGATIQVTGVKVYFTGGTPTAQKLTMSTVSCSNSGENENSLTSAWTSVSNATGYKVSTDGGTTWGATITALSYTWSNLNAGTEYTLYVKAIGDGTNFTDSDPIFAKGTTKAIVTGGLTLPYSYNGNATNLTNDNITKNGVGDYATTNAMIKFSAQGNYIIFHTSTAPSSFSCNTCQNGQTAGSVLTLSGSSDGVSYTTIATFTISQGDSKHSTKSSSISNTSYRYLKIEMTTRKSNVGVGQISIQ